MIRGFRFGPARFTAKRERTSAAKLTTGRIATTQAEKIVFRGGEKLAWIEEALAAHYLISAQHLPAIKMSRSSSPRNG